MKMRFVLVALGVMIFCYVISALFFLNSGIINDSWDLDEVRTIEIFRELDKIPMINIDSSEINFKIYGEIIEMDESSLSIENYRGSEFFFHDEDLSGFERGDIVMIYYRYSESYDKEIVYLKKLGDN